MLSLISKLQRKPEHVRKKIAMIASAVITGIIAVIWLTSLSSSLEGSAPPSRSDEKEVGPLQALIDGFGGLFTDTADAIQTAAGAFSRLSKEVDTPAQEPTEKETAAPVSQ